MNLETAFTMDTQASSLVKELPERLEATSRIWVSNV